MDDDDLALKINDPEQTRHALELLDRFGLASPIPLSAWQGELLERALAEDVRVVLAPPRGHGRPVGEGWNHDGFGTWHWPASDLEQRDAVAATVAGWDLQALGVTP